MNIQEKNIHQDDSMLIIDGENARQEILMSIHEAYQSIRIRMYMWRDDSAGNMILMALRQKIITHPNIQIFIEKDIFGSLVYNLQNLVTFGKVKGDIFSSKTGRELLENIKNIHLSYVGSWLPIRLKYLRENDHSKVFVFDEFTKKSRALIGGMNIADQYLNSQEPTSFYTGGWHDYMVRLMGDLADIIALGRAKRHHRYIDRKIENGVEIFMTIKNRRVMRKKMLRELSQAKKSIIIEHGYLTDATIIRQLRRLSRKGVNVEIILPDHSDGVWHANMHSIYKLMRYSLLYPYPQRVPSVYLYPGMIHAKVVLIDQSVAIIGSANFTYGSFDFLHETNVIFRERGQVVASLSTQLQKDIALSRHLSLSDIPSYSKIFAWIQAIFI